MTYGRRLASNRCSLGGRVGLGTLSCNPAQRQRDTGEYRDAQTDGGVEIKDVIAEVNAILSALPYETCTGDGGGGGGGGGGARHQGAFFWGNQGRLSLSRDYCDMLCSCHARCNTLSSLLHDDNNAHPDNGPEIMEAVFRHTLRLTASTDHRGIVITLMGAFISIFPNQFKAPQGSKLFRFTVQNKKNGYIICNYMMRIWKVQVNGPLSLRAGEGGGGGGREQT